MYTNDVDLYPDIVKKWGLSFLINTAKTPEGRSAGSLAWAGLANTYFWIDPARNVAGVILMQLLPFVDAKALEAFAGFERGVYAGLDAGSRRRRKEHLLETVIARSEAFHRATKQSMLPCGAMDCFASLAMTTRIIVPRSRSTRARRMEQPT